MKKIRKASSLVTTLVLAVALMTGCGGSSQPSNAQQNGEQQQAGSESQPENKLSGSVVVDGSSTVFPITEAVAEEFLKVHPEVRTTVGVSGTGGGFKKFVAGETDINDSSRPIKKEEAELAKQNGIEWVELPIAFDGLSVVVNPANDWVDHLTAEELKLIWNPESTVKNWSDVRPEWPNEPIKLYGPGTDSGTFDYFTEAIMGKSGQSRADYTASEDDHVLVQGVSQDKYSLGYFGFAYYVENKDKMKIVPIKANADAQAIVPTPESINDGSYTPLSRPMFIHVNTKAMAEKPQVKAFVEFYLENVPELSETVGYIKLPDNMYQEAVKLIQ
ncbi:PstS family phosphate ABC transporter substrate-binding protein [Ammoniphilus sp. YIM 78166]|uniref:PstS family phosphate ABC transporter substrate-binding protein n=1 Tax=Ammoniphilus sp. YIM 78166 TaxID=1644106 RepID=UPI001F0E249B|nr:PstS family phosphate ABC transporter substrate-binding protein [Ammoniphilus sp. YIM 78166]